jgi:hypothetical protein
MGKIKEIELKSYKCYEDILKLIAEPSGPYILLNKLQAKDLPKYIEKRESRKQEKPTARIKLLPEEILKKKFPFSAKIIETIEKEIIDKNTKKPGKEKTPKKPDEEDAPKKPAGFPGIDLIVLFLLANICAHYSEELKDPVIICEENI